MIHFPEIREDDIQQWVGDKAFQRGYRYFEEEAILNPRRRGDCLISECQGSQTTPYRVEIHFDETHIREGCCSCPAGDGGHCKHVAALLLTWLHNPDEFVEVPELEQVLETSTKDELVELIQDMIARHPDLEQLVELAAMRHLREGEELPVELISQQIRRAYTGAGGEVGDPSQVAENLQPILDLGEELLDQGNIANAVVIYETLMDGLLNYEASLYSDTGGDLGQVLAECEQGIQVCLESTQDANIRQDLLHTLFEFFLWDVQSGGMGYADETPTILVKNTTSAEKEIVADWVQAELAQVDDRGGERQRRALGGLWLDLVGGQIDDETYLRICRQTGRTRDLVDRLLQLNRVDEALETARVERDAVTLTRFADLFEKHGHQQTAVQLMSERAEIAENPVLLEWRKLYALRHNQNEEALRLGQSLFWQVQSLENYKEMLNAARMLDQQNAVRAQVLERLESAGNYSLLVEIYLDEENEDLALAALERVNPEIWQDRMAVLRRQVARAIERDRPREAIRQYLLLAEGLIDQRNRGSYAEAAHLLQQVNRLYSNLGEGRAFESLIEGLRREYQRLPSLLDELRRVGL